MERRGLKENRRHGDRALPITCYRIGLPGEPPQRELSCHWHDEMELLQVESGTFQIQCGTEYFEAGLGQIVFFNSGELHAAMPEEGEGLRYSALVFSPELLCGDGEDMGRARYVAPVMDGRLQIPRVIEANSPLCAVFREAMELLEGRPPAYELLVRARMLELFAGLVERGKKSGPERGGASPQAMKTALEFIRQNYAAPLTVGQLSALTHMSEGHFCRTFKKYTFKTPIQYLNDVRLSEAMELLSRTDKRVLDISLDTGFNSLSYFIEVFKERVGCTPTEYRRR